VTTSEPAAAALAWARTADAFAESSHRWRSLSARAAEVAARRDAGDEGADALAEEVRSQAVALGATPLLTLLGDDPAPVAAEDGLYRFADVVVDGAQFQVRRDGDPVHAEPQVLEVLVHLIAHRDRVVTKDELFEAVWGGPFVGEAALSSRIRDVRRLVGDDGKAQHTIRTVHGRGYQFIADLDDGSGG
jgi:DNA-binding winged helix-turn-helix (wHTH) protein